MGIYTNIIRNVIGLLTDEPVHSFKTYHLYKFYEKNALAWVVFLSVCVCAEKEKAHKQRHTIHLGTKKILQKFLHVLVKAWKMKQ